MARIARAFPDVPHHVTRRGEARTLTFFNCDEQLYRDLLAEQAARCGVEVWSRAPSPILSI